MIFDVKYFHNGDKNTITIKNMSEEEILQHLNEKGYQIISITERKNIGFKRRPKKLKDKDLYILFSSLSILLSAGVDLKESLNILTDDTSFKYSFLMEEVNISISNGYTLSEALEKTQHFPDTVVRSISAGETSNTLGESTKLLADFYNKEHKLKQAIKNALYYPILLLIVTVFIIIMVMTFILPNYIDLYKSYGVNELPRLTRNIISFSAFVTNYYILIVLLLFIVIFLLNRILKNTKYKIILHKLVLKIPLIGKYILYLDLQRFSGVLSLMDSSGIDLLESVYTSSFTIKNYYLYSQFIKLKDKIISGTTLYHSIKEIELLPSIFLNLVKIGEETASINKTMLQAYTFFEEQNKEYSKIIISLFEPIIILLLGIVIGTIVIGIALPSFNIINIL